MLYIRYSSSTAHGGGPSFKHGNHGRTLGDVGCCESRMGPLLDREVIGVVFVRMVATVAMVAMVPVVTWPVTSATTAGCSLV